MQEGIIVDANRAWLELFGYSGDDALTGTPLMDLFEQETHRRAQGRAGRVPAGQVDATTA